MYLRLPNEDPQAKEPGVGGKLRKTMCGSLGAAQRLREHYAQFLEAGGFRPGEASPCHFFREGLQTHILVHSKLFFCKVGRREERKHTLSPLQGAYEVSKSRNPGARVVTISDSQFLGKNIDVATVENQLRARPAACFSRIEGSGSDHGSECGHSGTDDAGGLKVSEISGWENGASLLERSRKQTTSPYAPQCTTDAYFSRAAHMYPTGQNNCLFQLLIRPPWFRIN